MMRSFFSGVSGLRNHQTRMDVIGNNISNINTIGFKKGRVNFKESLALTIKGATRSSSGQNGSNPIQVGLGLGISSIDTFFSQGNLETTGRITDLAIEGEGFFVLRNGEKNHFSRAGAFSFDSDGRIVDTASSWVVQGILANPRGEIESSNSISDIILPFGLKSAARPTSKVTFSGNLDASAKPLGTVLKSGPLLGREQFGNDTDISKLYGRGQANSFITGLIPGTTTMTVQDGSITKTYTYVTSDTSATNSQFNSLDDLINEINSDFTTFSASFNNTTGAIEMVDLTGSSHILDFESNNPILRNTFEAASGLVNSATGKITATDEFSHLADENELLINIRNSTGENLNVVGGDNIIIGADVGTGAPSDSYAVDGATSTLGHFLNKVQETLNVQDLEGIKMGDNGTINIFGDAGEASAISAVSLRIGGNTAFNTAMSFTTIQDAKDVVHSSTVTSFDALGKEHTLTIDFTKSDVSNQWTWNIVAAGDEIISSGGSGNITFNSDGSLNSFIIDGGLSNVSIDPNNGAELMTINLNTGTVGLLDGITQFASASTAVASDQDGYGSGELDDFSISSKGRITGIFSNGISRDLAQMVLATFNNPGGLVKAGNNSYQLGNSGDPIFSTAGDSLQSNIISGSLEMSNVDLAQEFTNMIVAQRGFQANSRIITTSDEMLTELVNLKR